MKLQKRTKLLCFFICFFLAGSCAFAVLLLKGIEDKTTKELLQTLHDALFATGAFCLLWGGVLYANTYGAFLGVGYALHQAKQALFPFTKGRRETYAEYRNRKGREKTSLSQSGMLVVGALFILLSIIPLYAWYSL